MVWLRRPATRPTVAEPSNVRTFFSVNRKRTKLTDRPNKTSRKTLAKGNGLLACEFRLSYVCLCVCMRRMYRCVCAHARVSCSRLFVCACLWFCLVRLVQASIHAASPPKFSFRFSLVFVRCIAVGSSWYFVFLPVLACTRNQC